MIHCDLYHRSDSDDLRNALPCSAQSILSPVHDLRHGNSECDLPSGDFCQSEQSPPTCPAACGFPIKNNVLALITRIVADGQYHFERCEGEKRRCTIRCQGIERDYTIAVPVANEVSVRHSPGQRMNLTRKRDCSMVTIAVAYESRRMIQSTHADV